MVWHLSRDAIQQDLIQAWLDRQVVHQTTQAQIIYQDRDQEIWELLKEAATQLQSRFHLMANSLITAHRFQV